MQKKAKKSKLFIIIMMLAACILLILYFSFCNSAKKYGGHGFDYMHGYSSTDFKDYMVYSENSKLVSLEKEASFKIEKEEDMPVLDGAEACYPLYAAFAKAVYKNIDSIEKKWLNEADDQRFNGKIVTFSNSISGFTRLIRGGDDPEKYGDGVDIFFGARPSESQAWFAEESGVEIDITPIGREAFIFFVEADNPIDNLTTEQFKAIYHGDISNWNEIGGNNQKIKAFQRPNNSGSQTMMQYFMGDVSLKEPETYDVINAMDGIVKRVAQYTDEKGAIGYSFRYFVEGLNQEKNVKILSVDGVYPSLESIEDGSYPLVTDVCMMTRKGNTNPYIAKMIEFILSEEGQTIIKKTGYAGVVNQSTDETDESSFVDMMDFPWIYEENGVLIDNQYLEENQLKEVMAFLGNLPSDRETLVKDGGFLVAFANVYGKENLESFQILYEQGQPTNLLIGKYTDEGDLVFYYLIYDGKKLTLVVDTRRDKWAREQIFVTQHQYLSILEQEREGNIFKTVLLHNDPEMTVEKWTNLDPMDPKAWEGLFGVASFSN